MNIFTITKPNGSLTISADRFDTEASIPRIYLHVDENCFEWSQDCAEEIADALDTAARVAGANYGTFSFDESGIEHVAIKIEAAPGMVSITVGDSLINLTVAQALVVAEAWEALAGRGAHGAFYRTCAMTGLEAPDTDFIHEQF